jgi:hypothetical protein
MAEMPKATRSFLSGLGEFAIVVVGILVALGLDDLNEARKDRVLETQYLSELVVDLRSDSLELMENRATAMDRLFVAEQVLRSTDPDWRISGSGTPEEVVTALRAEWEELGGCARPVTMCLADYRVFDGSRGAYDELLGSGNLRVLGDRSLALSLAHYYALAEGERDGDLGRLRPAMEDFNTQLRLRGVGAFDPMTQAEFLTVLRSDPALMAHVRDLAALAMWQIGRAQGLHIRAVSEVAAQLHVANEAR